MAINYDGRESLTTGGVTTNTYTISSTDFLRPSTITTNNIRPYPLCDIEDILNLPEMLNRIKTVENDISEIKKEIEILTKMVERCYSKSAYEELENMLFERDSK